jgi:ABC-type microcin C transport system permease subunit YejB
MSDKLRAILEKIEGHSKILGYPCDCFHCRPGGTIDQAIAEIKEWAKGCAPEEKNFNTEVCMWRDDANMIKEVRGECRGHNSCRQQFIANIEGEV